MGVTVDCNPLTFDLPGNWQHWPPLPDKLECDQCGKSFKVGADVWLIQTDKEGMSHLCLDCTERFIYSIQRAHPEILASVASRLKLVLYRPDRDLTLDEIAKIEAATTMLQVSGRVICEHRETLH